MKRAIKPQKVRCDECGEVITDFELFINGHECKKRPMDIWLFPNGMIVACDDQGEQIPDLQGPFTHELHVKLTQRALPGCNWKGLKPIGK